APEPAAPPCIRQRFLPRTAGEEHGLPERVLAPQRGLHSMGPVFRLWLTMLIPMAPGYPRPPFASHFARSATLARPRTGYSLVQQYLLGRLDETSDRRLRAITRAQAINAE